MPDLHELCAAAVEAATGDEAVEAYAEESRHTEASALRGEIEGLTFAESRGVGRPADRRRPARLRVRGRPDARRGARGGPARAGERGARRARRVQPAGGSCAGETDRRSCTARTRPSIPTDRKVALALDLERRAISIDPRASKIDAAQIGDAVSRVAIASTTGVRGRVRADRRLVRRGLARRGGRRDADRVLVHDRPRHRRAGLGGDRRRGGASARCACWAPRSHRPRRSRSCSTSSRRCRSWACWPGALSAEAVLKQRSLFASMVGQQVGSELFTLVDDGTITIGPAASPFDDEGVPTGPDRAVHARHAERVPAQHVHGRADRRRHALHRQREARRLQEHARRGHVELLPGRRASCRSTSCSSAAEGGVLDPGRQRRALRREPDQRRVLASGRRACGSPAARWASRCAR